MIRLDKLPPGTNGNGTFPGVDDTILRYPSNTAAPTAADLDDTQQLSSINSDRNTLDALDDLHITYEECAMSLEFKNNTKRLKKPIQWIHFPKCGTSFGATIYGYLCSPHPTPFSHPSKAGVNCNYCGEKAKGLQRGLYWDPKLRNMIPFSNRQRKDGSQHRFADYYAPFCDWDQTPYPPYSNHFAFSLEKRWGRKTDVVAMFRDPRKRLVSAWNNDKHSYGASQIERQTIKPLQNFSSFLYHPSIPGCQTKMMVSRNCADSRTLSPEHLSLAKKRVTEDLSFVGITDAFNMSVCLFHHMHGGVPKPFMFQTVQLCVL